MCEQNNNKIHLKLEFVNRTEDILQTHYLADKTEFHVSNEAPSSRITKDLHLKRRIVFYIQGSESFDTLAVLNIHTCCLHVEDFPGNQGSPFSPYRK